MLAFLRLIRWPNLLMIAVTQAAIHYAFLIPRGIPVALNDSRFLLLVLATMLIAAGGYIINDIFDQPTDAVNRPDRVIIGKSISEKTAYNLYTALNIVAIAIGYYLSDFIGRSNFIGVFIVIAWLLYLYASSFKRTMVLGNAVVALLTAMVVIVTGIFDLVGMIDTDNRGMMAAVFEILLDYAGFCFIVSLVREIIKDLEDTNGDYRAGMNTLPIALGRQRTQYIAFVLGGIPVIWLLLYTYFHFIANQLFIAAAYMIFAVVAPLCYFEVKLLSAKTDTDFRHLSQILKIALLAGILSIGVLTLNIAYNAA